MTDLTKKEIILIVAYLSKNRGIGFQGKLPWGRIEVDITNFKARTMGHTVIMGKDTLASRDGKPFKGRQNIVVSTTLTTENLPEGVLLAKTLEEAIAMATGEKIFIIGGVGLYQEAIEKDLAHTILATVIYDDLECDRFFPEIPNHWLVVDEGNKGMDPGSEIDIRFVKFKNTRNPLRLAA